MSKDLTTLFTGRSSSILTEVDSTNSYLSRILKDSHVPEGASVRALKQIVGRGQGQSHWESEKDQNLLVSFVFYPSFIAPKQVFLLNKAFTIGVFDCIRSFLDADVK